MQLSISLVLLLLLHALVNIYFYLKKVIHTVELVLLTIQEDSYFMLGMHHS